MLQNCIWWHLRRVLQDPGWHTGNNFVNKGVSMAFLVLACSVRCSALLRKAWPKLSPLYNATNRTWGVCMSVELALAFCARNTRDHRARVLYSLPSPCRYPPRPHPHRTSTVDYCTPHTRAVQLLVIHSALYRRSVQSESRKDKFQSVPKVRGTSTATRSHAYYICPYGDWGRQPRSKSRGRSSTF